VYDVKDDGLLEILMPMEHSKIVLLPLNGEYDVCFYSQGAIYRANVRIVDRQKVDGVYLLVTELTSNLHKFQRREYYRFSCVTDVDAKEITYEELETLRRGEIDLVPQDDMVRGVIVDISGGGARFVADKKFTDDGNVLMKFTLEVSGATKEFLLPARVLYSTEIENRKGSYENRVKFEYINNTTREEIIKYIFDEERKNRKNGKGR
jgi:c-di-GMP-binding flagellar brake protein YcgR